MLQWEFGRTQVDFQCLKMEVIWQFSEFFLKFRKSEIIIEMAISVTI